MSNFPRLIEHAFALKQASLDSGHEKCSMPGILRPFTYGPHADIAESLSRPEALATQTFGDEANIAYLSACTAQAGVGFTRAIRHLNLPPVFIG